ncbi:MAG: hypothetical protein JJE39_09630 [Vicinamibacteria bacterium]|nr:hypothetical protein [Vicinamibacteria bacterium]
MVGGFGPVAIGLAYGALPTNLKLIDLHATIACGFLLAGAQANSTDGILLKDAVTREALPAIANADYQGLGAEVRKLVSWVMVEEHQAPYRLFPRDLRIEENHRLSFAISAPLAVVLDRLNQWYGLAAPSDHPITHEQLIAATLAPESVDRIRVLFESAIRRGAWISGQWLTPEVGGEATLDAELRLVEANDPKWSLALRLTRAGRDPGAVASLYERPSAGIASLDTHGLLRAALGRWKLGLANSPEEVRRAVATLVQNAAPTFSLSPEEQFALIAGATWRGRYVGGWHTHSPHDLGGQWGGGDVPSFEDMQNAVQAGQYLTLSFQPDGFDLYDASALSDAGRVDLALLKLIRYRSAAWSVHFRRLLPKPEPEPGPQR